mgnify:FL=1
MLTEDHDVWVAGSKGVELKCRADFDEATIYWLSWNKTRQIWDPVCNGSENLIFIDSNEHDSSTLKFMKFVNATESISKELSTQYMCVVWWKLNNTVSFSDQITIRYPCKYYSHWSAEVKKHSL